MWILSSEIDHKDILKSYIYNYEKKSNIIISFSFFYPNIYIFFLLRRILNMNLIIIVVTPAFIIMVFVYAHKISTKYDSEEKIKR